MKEKKIIPIVAATAAVILIAAFAVYCRQASAHREKDEILAGLICDGDQSTPYSENFIQSMSQLQTEYGDRLKVDIRCNITPDNCANVINELVDEGADLIITNSYGFGEAAKKAAGKNPDVQFVQATQVNAGEKPVYANYHTFMGRIYEGRYIAGQVAGRKLSQLIKDGNINSDQALVGYVGAYRCPEVISGFTAFFLGVKDQCPSATMKVIYTDTWADYQKEYDTARDLVNQGCVIISQHSDTTGPAVACADMAAGHTVFHVGYNTSMISVAPSTTLISTRIEWTPYLRGAVEAVLSGRSIEKEVSARINGQDAGAGFDMGWVRMLALNKTIAPKGTEKMIEKSIDEFKKGELDVFRGNYKGYDPDNPKNTIDLKKGYHENENQSAPTFHYIIDGITQ